MPGEEFGCVTYFAGVMGLESLVQIARLSGVELIGMGIGLEDVDVMEGHTLFFP